jgi:hypothetical protein
LWALATGARRGITATNAEIASRPDIGLAAMVRITVSIAGVHFLSAFIFATRAPAVALRTLLFAPASCAFSARFSAARRRARIAEGLSLSSSSDASGSPPSSSAASPFAGASSSSLAHWNASASPSVNWIA